MIILCRIDSGDVDARPTPSQESRHRSLWSLPTAFTPTESALLIFLQSGVEKLVHRRPQIEPATLDLNSQSGAYDLSATVTPIVGVTGHS